MTTFRRRLFLFVGIVAVINYFFMRYHIQTEDAKKQQEEEIMNERKSVVSLRFK